MLMSIYIFSHLIKISLRVSIIRQFIYMLNVAMLHVMCFIILYEFAHRFYGDFKYQTNGDVSFKYKL